jgi:arginase
MNRLALLTGLLSFLICVPPLLASAAAPSGSKIKLKVTIVKNDAEGPKYLAEGGLLPLLEKLGCDVQRMDTAVLTPEERKEYGAWNRDALESRRIGQLAAADRLGDGLIIGLLTDCTDLLGMLAGLQHLKPAGEGVGGDERSLQRDGLAGLKPLRVGLIYLDAHADFNTPETTLSGMLGGMDVAAAAGMCLTRLRLKTGLDPALPTRYIVFGGLRDVDPLEQELLDRSDCEFLSVDDIRAASDAVETQMKRLTRLTDVIYVHVDMDVLDPAEVSGFYLPAPLGPKSQELADCLRRIFKWPKAAALGIASSPFGERDTEGHALRAAHRLIEAAVLGTKSRTRG